MATAVETGSEQQSSSTPTSLAFASLIGAVYVVAAIAVVFYAVPAVWNDFISPNFGGFKPLDVGGRLLIQLAAGTGLVAFGRKLLGDSPPKGIHGGIFLVISAAITIFFLWRAVALNFETTAGLVIATVLAGFLVFITIRFFVGKTGQQWMLNLEEQGWFSTASYKRSLGMKARRFTILGILIICVTGIYTIRPETGILPEDWTLSLPFDSPAVIITVLPDARYMIPLLLLALALWAAWRVVNVPSFAEFLIATEAEMNKVSWTPKKRLVQDTVVVLTTTLLLALFLLVVDIFWGWLLSMKYVEVLPSRSTDIQKGKNLQAQKW